MQLPNQFYFISRVLYFLLRSSSAIRADINCFLLADVANNKDFAATKAKLFLIGANPHKQAIHILSFHPYFTFIPLTAKNENLLCKNSAFRFYVLAHTLVFISLKE
jgi:hypothetical protein